MIQRSDARPLAVAGVGLVGLSVWLADLLAGVAIASRLDLLPQAALAAVACLVVLLSLRWPLLPLLAFAAVIPIEEVIKVGDVGSISRVVGLLFALTYGVPRLGRLSLRAMPLAGYAFVGWAILSYGWAMSPGTSLVELPTLVQLLVIGLLVADMVARRPEIVRPILWTYTLSATVTSAIGILAYVNGTIASGERVAAFQDQDVAQFAALLLPAFVFSLHELLRGSWRLLSAATATIALAGIVLSGTRGAWLSSATVFIVFVLPQVRPSRRVLAVAFALLAVIVVVQLPGVTALIEERTALALSTGGAGRTDIWTVGTEIFQTSPLVGVGFANFPVAYTPELVKAAAISGYTSAAFGPHSIVIGTLGELGMIGLVILAAFVLPLIFRVGWGPDAAAIRSIVASLMIAALFLDVVSNRKQVWLAIGIASGLAYIKRRAREPGQVVTEPPGRGPFDTDSSGLRATARTPDRGSSGAPAGPGPMP